jgi:hypothetical protein
LYGGGTCLQAAEQAGTKRFPAIPPPQPQREIFNSRYGLIHLSGGASPRGPGGLPIPGLRRAYGFPQGGRLLTKDAELPIQQVEGGEWFSGRTPPGRPRLLSYRDGRDGAAAEDGYGDQECTSAIAVPDAFHSYSERATSEIR